MFRRSFWNYARAVGFVAGATVAEYFLWPWVQPSLSPLFTAAVLFSALYGGLRPALLATVLSAVASAFFFLPPAHSLSIGPDDALRLAVFTAVAVVVSSVAAARRRAELRLAEAWAAAERANSAKERLFAVVSHELRNPISPVLAAAQLLEEDKTLPEWVGEDARMVRRNIEVQLRLIDDLLDFNRIEHGKLPLEVSRVDLRDVISDSTRMCEQEADAKGVRLDSDFDPTGAIVEGDRARLSQVFANLLRNALKFTPPDGRVSVRLLKPENGRVRVEVADTGAGISAAVLPTIFHPFEQGGAETTRRYGGLGLGLAIARGVVEQHGGSISVSSGGVGRGSTFAVEVPLADPGGNGVAARPAPERMRGVQLQETGPDRP